MRNNRAGEREAPQGRWSGQHSRNVSSYSLQWTRSLRDLLVRSKTTGDSRQSDLDGIEQKVRDKDFRIAVAALMKCGKSTFISCLLREAMLPEDILPETAAIVSLKHVHNLPSPQLFRVGDDALRATPLAIGPRDIYYFLKDLNDYLRKVSNGLEPSNPHRFNDTMKELKIHVNIPSLRDFDQGCGIEFIMMDTPGYNEITAVVTESTKMLLKVADVVVYLLDITKVGSTDEANFLSKLLMERPDLLEDRRSYFLLNKADMAQYDQATLNRGRSYVMNFLSRINPSLTEAADQTCFALSTKDFLTSDLAISRKIHLDEHIASVKSTLYGRFAPADFNIHMLTDVQVGSLEQLKVLSNVGPVETAIMSSLTENAPRMHAICVAAQLIKFCRELHSSLSVRTASLELGKEATRNAILSLRRALEATESVSAELAREVETRENTLLSNLQSSAPVFRQELEAEIARISSTVNRSSHATPQAAQDECNRYLTSACATIRLTLCRQKVQLDLRMREEVNQCTTNAQEMAGVAITNVILQSLEGILPSERICTLRGQLLRRPQWGGSNVSDWVGVNIDAAAIQQGCINEIEETVVKDIPKLRPAVFETRERTVGGGDGGEGCNPVDAAMAGGSIGSTLGPVGAVVGGVMGFIGGMFGGGGSRSTTTIIKEQVQVKPAEIYFQKENQQVTMHKVDYVRVQNALNTAAANISNEFLVWYAAQGAGAFASIRSRVEEHYLHSFRGTVL